MRHTTLRNIVTVLLFGCAGCDWQCPENESTSSAKHVSYTPSQVEAWVSAGFTSPSASANFQVASYSVSSSSAPLPAGLTLDTSTGAISGVPTAPEPPTSRDIIAREPGGITHTTSITIEVHDAIAPSGLSYAPNPIVGAQGAGVTSSIATLTTGVAQWFDISPPLPTGLEIDVDTGVISGYLGGALGTTQHTITASNPLGFAQTTLDVSIVATSTVEGFLVPSSQDQTLDGFAFDWAGLNAVDFEYFFGSTPRAVAATSDGSFVYVAGSDSYLYLVRRDPVSGALEPPMSLGQTGNIRRMAVTSGDQYLIAIADFQAVRYSIQAGGSILFSGQATAPGVGTSAICVGPNASYLAVAASSPGSLWIYDITPTFALRGTRLDLGTYVSVDDLLATSTSLYAATSTYDFAISTFHGHLRSYTVASAAQVAGGDPALDPRQNIALGNHLTSLAWIPSDGIGAFGFDFAITDGGLSRVYLASLDSGDIETPVQSHTIAGFPADCLALNRTSGKTLWVLDSIGAVIRGLDPANWLAVVTTIKTRSYPLELIPVQSARAARVTDSVFVPGTTDADLRSLQFSSPTGFSASAQTPLSTGVGAWDAVAHPFLPAVYTAQRDSASLGVYAYDPATQQLTHVEDEAMSQGSQPIALAVGLGGHALFVADEGGRVCHADIDQASGELTAFGGSGVTGSMVDARLCADPIGRYVFLVQPFAGRITTLSVFPNTGFPLVTATSTAVSQPVDIAVSEDGRFAYVLDRALARVVAFTIDMVSGDLILTNGGFSIGVAPTRMELADWSGTSHVFVIDPTANTCFTMLRDESTGALSAALQPSFSITSGATAVSSYDAHGNFGVLFTHENAGGATFEVHRVAAQGAFAPWSTHAAGHGPNAIAMRSVSLAY